MQFINIHNAKTNLSKLLDSVITGHEIVICKSGKPIAKLTKYEQEATERKAGFWKNQVQVSADFDDVPEEFMRYFK